MIHSSIKLKSWWIKKKKICLKWASWSLTMMTMVKYQISIYTHWLKYTNMRRKHFMMLFKEIWLYWPKKLRRKKTRKEWRIWNTLKQWDLYKNVFRNNVVIRWDYLTNLRKYNLKVRRSYLMQTKMSVKVLTANLSCSNKLEELHVCIVLRLLRAWNRMLLQNLPDRGSLNLLEDPNHLGEVLLAHKARVATHLAPRKLILMTHYTRRESVVICWGRILK